MSGMTIKGEYILQTVTWREDREAQARGMKELIRCQYCKKWKRNDGTFPDFDGDEWHKCEALEQYRHAETCDTPVTPAWFYCGYAEVEEE